MYLSIFVPRLLIIRMARMHCVSRLSMTWGMRPLRFLETLSSGVNEVPGILVLAMNSAKEAEKYLYSTQVL